MVSEFLDKEKFARVKERHWKRRKIVPSMAWKNGTL